MLHRKFDAGILNAPREVTGGVVYSARVASTAPLTYADPGGGSHLERRTADELQRIVDQLPGSPIVLGHPGDGMLAEGSAHPVVGTVQSACLERGGGTDHAVADLLIRDSATLDAIRAGTKGISLGYGVDSLVPDGSGGYLQRGCKLDHVAIVGAPRCHTCTQRSDRFDCAGSAACSCRGSSARSDDDMSEVAARRRMILANREAWLRPVESTPVRADSDNEHGPADDDMSEVAARRRMILANREAWRSSR